MTKSGSFRMPVPRMKDSKKVESSRHANAAARLSTVLMHKLRARGEQVHRPRGSSQCPVPVPDDESAPELFGMISGKLRPPKLQKLRPYPSPKLAAQCARTPDHFELAPGFRSRHVQTCFAPEQPRIGAEASIFGIAMAQNSTTSRSCACRLFLRFISICMMSTGRS
jgi:hypothetical protein